jgi:hypothetical protein
LGAGAWALSCGDNGNGTNGGSCEGDQGKNDPTCQLLLPDSEPKAAGGAADYSCLANVTPEGDPDKDLIIRGKTQQRLSNGDDEDKGGVTVEVWTDQTSLSDATRIATATSDAAGDYEIEIPASAWASASEKGVRVAWRISSADTVPTVEYNDPIPIGDAQPDGTDPSKLALEDLNRITVTRSTLQTIVSLLGITTEYDKNKGIILGVVRDCKRAEVESASAGIVDAAGKPVDGPLLYYFRSKFPVIRSQQPFTSNDGYFVLINVEPNTDADVRVVGKLSGQETVLSRQVVPVSADTIVIADFDPLPEPLN